MSVVTDTTNNENVLTQKRGSHKGCPYDRLAGGYFHRNADSLLGRWDVGSDGNYRPVHCGF